MSFPRFVADWVEIDLDTRRENAKLLAALGLGVQATLWSQQSAEIRDRHLNWGGAVGRPPYNIGRFLVGYASA